MNLFQNILVGVALDMEGMHLSRSSERAVVQARWIAERVGAKLTIFHSTWDDRSPASVRGGVLFAGRPAPDLSRVLEPVRQELEQAGIATELVIEDERPWLAITQRVVRGLHDLVLVANREGEQANSIWLGTNALKLVRKCPAPVWVVDPRHAAVGRSILAATDLSPVGARAVQLGKALAAEWECELHVVHALEVPYGILHAHGSERNAGREAVLLEIEADARAEIESELLDVPGGVEPKLHVQPGRASSVILDCIEEFDPDLLVVGTISRLGIKGMLVGNTAEKLLGRVNCSMLAIKPEGFVSPVHAD